MGSEWTESTLEELSSSVAYGYTESASQDKIGPHFLRITDIQNGVVDWNSVPYCPISEKDHLKYKLNEGDIVVARTGNSTGENYLFEGSHDAVFASYLIRFCIDDTLAHPKFVWYSMRSQNWWAFVNGSKTGSAQAGANAKVLGRFPVDLPPLSEQKAIAHILGPLDDKIELNRRMNATLEGMAQALFKSWFVDFDPVIDNALAAGNPIPDELADRAEVRRQALANGTANREAAKPFPAAFQQTESMGWIPEGWEPREVGEFAEIKHGYAFKGEYFSSDKTDDVLVTPGNFRIGGGFKSDKLKFYDGPIADGYVLQANDLVVTMTDLSKAGDTLGYPAFIPPSDQLTYHHNQRVGLVNLKTQEIGKHYLYQIFKSAAYRDEILGSMSGSTVKHTSPSKISAFRFPFTGGAIEQAFEMESSAIEDKITLNNSASESLTKLRDTLLPKLISGEVCRRQPESLTKKKLA